MNQHTNTPYDSRLGEIKTGMTLFSKAELEEWLRNNSLRIEGAIKRALGVESGLAKMAERLSLEIVSSQDPKPKPNPYSVVYYSVTADGKMTIRLKRKMDAFFVDYSQLAEGYVADADAWLNDKMEHFVATMRDRAQKQRKEIDREAARESESVLKTAKATIKEDSELDPRVRSARVQINQSYAAKVNSAAKLIELEAKAIKNKKPFAEQYAEAKAAGLI
jgi:hypothetical protein